MKLSYNLGNYLKIFLFPFFFPNSSYESNSIKTNKPQKLSNFLIELCNRTAACTLALNSF